MFKNPNRGGEEKPDYFKLLETIFSVQNLKKNNFRLFLILRFGCVNKGSSGSGGETERELSKLR